MSDHNYRIEATPPSNTKYVWTGVAFGGLILAIGLIVAVLYFPNRIGDPTEDIIVERKANLAEVQAKQQELISEYAWVDKANGVVRIPVEQAMKLVVEELESKGSR